MTKVQKEEPKDVVQAVTKTADAALPAVVTTKGATLPAHLAADMSGDDVAGLGNSGDSRDAVMPFLAILQKGSPQCDEAEAAYIDGAKPGMIINTATGQMWSGADGVIVIPCGYQKNYVEWKPSRQGWAGSHPFDVEHIKSLGAKKKSVMVEGKERTVIALPNGNQLAETAYTFLIVDGSPAIIGAASTALGPMRQWMSYRRSQKLPNRKELPAFGKKYKLTTVRETNESGSWYNWKFADADFVFDSYEYEEAKKFAIAIAKGEVQVGRPDEFAEAPGNDETGHDGSGDDVGI